MCEKLTLGVPRKLCLEKQVGGRCGPGAIVYRSLVYSNSEASGKDEAEDQWGYALLIFVLSIPIVENLANTEKFREENRNCT